MKKKVEYLIVGQGLAGTFLAFELLKRNKTFIVVDKGHESSSSIIAAGVINPLVLKRLTLTWRADEFLNYNTPFYNELESLLGKKYHFLTPIKKLISSKDEEDFWVHRFHKADLEKYIEEKTEDASEKLQLKEGFKVGNVRQTSWVNISQLLSDFRQYLLNERILVEESFDYDLIKEQTSYRDISFKNILFCEGAMALKNPFFNYLPFSLNKGQILTINSDRLDINCILKKKVFVLPVGESNYKVGATYSWKWEDEKPEKNQTLVLEKQLKEMIEIPYKKEEVAAGIRPAVKDRRPLIGPHHIQKNYFIFNGMGSRGCFMAPLLSKELVEHLENGKHLHPEVLVSRYSGK